MHSSVQRAGARGRAAGSTAASASDPPGPSRLAPAGERLALDDLGPLIVAEDGSLRRIANWEGLSYAERAAALRRLGKRNRQRLATLEERQQLEQLQAQQAAEQQQQEEEEKEL